MAKNIGDTNIKFGWMWLLVFTMVGAGLEIWLGLSNFENESHVRDMITQGHVHGLLLAFLNIFYGAQIDGTNLSKKAKKIGSICAVSGMIIMSLALLTSAFIDPLKYLAPIGGTLIIVSVAFMATGIFNKK